MAESATLSDESNRKLLVLPTYMIANDSRHTEVATVSDESSGDLRDASNVLVLAPNVADAGIDACTDLLLDATDRVDRLVVVAVGTRPSEWHGRLTDGAVGSLAPVRYVDVRTLVRSTSAEEHSGDDVPVPVATISSPADLLTLGRSINSLLSDAADDGDRVALCVHSISEMLQFVDREFLFKFLHAVSARVRSVGGVAFYHLDNDAPDEELRIMFSHLCDTVATFEGEQMEVSAGYYAPAGEGSET